MPATRALTDSWRLAHLTVPNRVVLAPLAGIGTWFVRLQAKRHGAGMAFSEMVSSHAVHHRNPKTCTELLRLHPDERAPGYGPTAVQLFGRDPDVMRSAAGSVAAAGADLVDLNMGCPVPKVMKTGAGVALLTDHDLAVEVARAAAEGSGLPVTVKLRSGLWEGDTRGVQLARRLVADAGVSAIGFHPRTAKAHHRGEPDLDLARDLVDELPVPVVLSGGMRSPEWIRAAWEHTGAEAVMLARGALGNPWLFTALLGDERTPSAQEVVAELDWVLHRAVEHWGEARAARALRRFYPWYVERLGGDRALCQALVDSHSIAAARALLSPLSEPPVAA